MAVEEITTTLWVKSPEEVRYWAFDMRDPSGMVDRTYYMVTLFEGDSLDVGFFYEEVDAERAIEENDFSGFAQLTMPWRVFQAAARQALRGRASSMEGFGTLDGQYDGLVTYIALCGQSFTLDQETLEGLLA